MSAFFAFHYLQILPYFSSLVSCHSLLCPIFLPPQHLSKIFMLPDLCSLCPLLLECLSTCQNSTHLSRPSSNVTSSVSFLPVFILPFFTRILTPPMSSHNALTLYHSTLCILLCLSSLLDSESFILTFTASSMVPGTNNWNQKRRRENRGHMPLCHVQ